DSLRHGLGNLRGGLTGALRLGVIPAAMAVVGTLLDPFCAAHPAVTVEIRSMTSKAIEQDLGAFELDAGLTYLDNEPLRGVRRVPLYLEHYLFACPAGHPLADRAHVRWSEAAKERLCLLSEDMQNRRILDGVFAGQNIVIHPDVVSNSFLAILSQLRSGGWSTIVPHSFAALFGGQPDIALVPLIEPVHLQSIGLVTTDREPAPPLARALEAAVRTIDFSSLDHAHDRKHLSNG
ncbi:MAG: LysR family transcriptional regulator substrate-binding protein, partial [Sphingomicrobium sp.]